jgi:GntR family transcriptional regulator
VLESYASLARRQGKRLTTRNVEIEQSRVPGYVAEELDLRRGARAPLIQRTLLADGTVAAYMRDVVHPEIELPPPDELREALGSGKMVLDVLVEGGHPIAFARTQVRPRLVEPGGRVGDALGVTRITAALELAELLHAPGGRAVQYSINVFAPGSVDLHVIRAMEAQGAEAQAEQQAVS